MYTITTYRNNERDYIDPLDLEHFGVEGKIDNEYNEEDVQVVCLTIHPLSPDNLTIPKDKISPLTKDIPQHNLTDRFQFALTIVLDVKDNQNFTGELTTLQINTDCLTINLFQFYKYNGRTTKIFNAQELMCDRFFLYFI